MIKNKKGASRGFKITLGVLAAITVIILIMILAVAKGEAIKESFSKGTIQMGDFLSSSSEGVKTSLNYISYIFGPIPNYLQEVTTNKFGPLIIVFAVWFLIFLTFADVIATFGTFSKEVSWGVGALITIIAANLKGTVYITLLFTTVFATLGLLGIFAGLFSAIVVFFIVNWGIGSAGGWLGKRRQLEKVAKGEAYLKSGIKGLTGAGKELEKAGATSNP